MSLTTTFHSAYDCLPQQLPLALGRARGGVAVGQDNSPTFGDTACQPVANTAATQAQGFCKEGNAAFGVDSCLKNVHTHDYYTSVRTADTQSHRQNESMNKISQRLKEARTQRGWNQAQLALAAGVSPGTIGNIESGARQAKGSLPQIAKALGISHDWLANGEGEMKVVAGQPAKADTPGPSSQAALLALLFDRLNDDVILRAQVFNKASEIIINTIQGTDCAPDQAPSAPAHARKQSV